jgi:iron complex transport system substrate-binding protein
VRFSAVVLPLLLLLAAPARAGDVVSLNLCTDDFLVKLAPARVAALSPLARDPALSVVASAAAHLPWVRADAEAVLRLHPALVLAGPYGAQTTLAALRRAGLRVVETRLPDSFPEIRAETMRLAVLLGVPARGAALLARMNARLAGIHRTPRLRALPLAPRGYSSGPGTLEDAVLRAAGLVNMATGRRLGLEAILVDRPNLLVVASTPEFPSLATDMLRHPALRGIPRRRLPPALLACGGPWTARAVQLLAQ